MNRTRIRCALLVTTLCTATAWADWTQYGGPAGQFRTTGALPETLKYAWQRPLDAGTSGVLVYEDMLFTQVATQQASESAPYREGFVAMRLDNGETVWRTDYDARRYDQQQTFGGAKVNPQATPALVDGVLVGLGFGGILTGLDAKTGQQLWQHDLVEDHKAPPVQFGFAGSPVVHARRIYVLAGGSAGLMCLDPRTGTVVWQVSCAGASYATPCVLKVAGRTHIVALTQDTLFGVDADTGKQVWEYKLPKPGMTNVPTPLSVGGGRMLISGQGIGGTRLLAIEAADQSFAVREVWNNRKAEFFYGNWTVRDGYVYGCDGVFLNALRLDSGIAAWRSRGAQESNLTIMGNEAFVVHGKNGISRMKLDGIDTAVTWYAKPDLGRCWVAPTVAKDRLLIRSETQLFCLEAAATSAGDFQAVPWEHEPKRDTRGAINQQGAQRIEQIQTAFEKGGPDAAWQAYERIHNQHPKQLGVEERIELANMAAGEGLIDPARQILLHAVEVYPSSSAATKALADFQKQHPMGKE